MKGLEVLLACWDQCLGQHQLRFRQYKQPVDSIIKIRNATVGHGVRVHPLGLLSKDFKVVVGSVHQGTSKAAAAAGLVMVTSDVRSEEPMALPISLLRISTGTALDPTVTRARQVSMAVDVDLFRAVRPLRRAMPFHLL